MTPAGLDKMIAAMRAHPERYDAPLCEAFRLLADIRDAERALRKAQEEAEARSAEAAEEEAHPDATEHTIADAETAYARAKVEVSSARARLRALGVTS